ncbi:MAG: NADH-quinone oxidoreductase subunit C [Deltaproteobacteria bacterium]|nr:NADH-quinone oxidoreductase subunit C [Deltaproteobacteria bacterium]
MFEEEQKKRIETNFDSSLVSIPKKGRLIVSTSKESLSSLLLLLKAGGFAHLSLISCVDWIDDGELELCYHVWSQEQKIHAIVKTRIHRDSAHFISIIPIFQHAQTYEREIHEMFGVHFEGNPRLIPFLLEHWEDIPPMRKDFDLRKYAKDRFGAEERAE